MSSLRASLGIVVYHKPNLPLHRTAFITPKRLTCRCKTLKNYATKMKTQTLLPRSISRIPLLSGMLFAALVFNPRFAVSDDTGEALFRERIAPVLAARCNACHGAKEEGGYSLATAEQLLKAGDSEAMPIVAGQLDASELWQRLVTDDASLRMPVDADPLTDAQLSIIKTWIESGAKIAKEDLTRPLSALSLPSRVTTPEFYPRPLSVNAIAIVNNDTELLIGGYAELTRWKIETGELLSRLPVSGPHIAAISVAANGKQVVVSSGSPGQRGVIELMDLSASSVRSQLPATPDVAADIAISPSGTHVAIGGQDGSLRIAELHSDRFGEVISLTPHADSILAVAWSNDGKRLITASRDRTAKLFDTQSFELIASYDRHERAVGGIGFLGKRPMSLDETGRLRMMAGDDSDGVVAEQNALPRLLQRFESMENELLIADRNRIRRFRSEKKKVSDGKTEDGKPKTKDVTRLIESDALVAKSPDWITSIAAAETIIAAGTQRGTVSVWNNQTGQQINEFDATPRRP